MSEDFRTDQVDEIVLDEKYPGDYRCPAYQAYINKDNDIDEINARFNGYHRLLLVFAAVTILIVYIVAQVYCGAIIGKPLVLDPGTREMIIGLVVAAIGGETAVQSIQAYKKYKRG